MRQLLQNAMFITNCDRTSFFRMPTVIINKITPMKTKMFESHSKE